MDDTLKEELNYLRLWARNQDTMWLMANQDMVMQIIQLLTHGKFRGLITAIRNGINIPPEWYLHRYKKVRDLDKVKPDEWNVLFAEFETNWERQNLERLIDEFWDWIDKHKGEGYPMFPDTEPIRFLCRQIRIDPNLYSSFVFNYLYFGAIEIEKGIFSLHVDNEFRYKAKVEFKGAKDVNQRVLYIRIFQNTSKYQLRQLVEDKKVWKLIKDYQAGLSPYDGQEKKFEKFDRDVHILLLKNLGKSVKNITDKLAEIEPAIDEKTVRDKLEDFDLYFQTLTSQ